MFYLQSKIREGLWQIFIDKILMKGRKILILLSISWFSSFFKRIQKVSE